MSNYSIIDFRINGERYYLVEKDDKVSFYTTNIAAARYWIRSEMNDPTLIRPFQTSISPEDIVPQSKESIDENSSMLEVDATKESKTTEVTALDESTPQKPVRIS